MLDEWRLNDTATRRTSEAVWTAAVVVAVYMAGGWLLAFHYNSINGDALSRVANGGYVLFSRDPHLAAIGFVWNPLPSFVEMPLLLLHSWVPSLISRGFAGNIMSAVFGGIAVWALAGMLADEKVPRPTRWVLTAAFALHPLVLYAGANGMSEAPYLCFLLVSARYLLQWVRNGRVRPLVIAGLALAFGYLTRYEVIVAAAAEIGLVGLLSVWRSHGGVRARALSAATEACVIGAPVAFAFAAWALVSWLIVGSPFAQFTSQYGNSAQLALGAGGTPGGPHQRLHYVTHQVLLLEPLLAIVVVVAIAAVVARRDAAALVPFAVFGSILVFEVFAFLKGQTASWLRYYIVEIPMVVVLAGLFASRQHAVAASRPPPGRQRSGGRPLALAMRGIVVAASIVGVAVSTTIVNSPSLAREETNQLQPIFYRNSPRAKVLRRLGTERQIAMYIASLHLTRGAVLMDVARAFTIWTQAPHPKVYLITPDRDFAAAVQDPVAFHVQYLLAEPPTGLGSTDELNREYPSLFATGAGIATLVREFRSTSDLGDWRLYKVIGST